MIKSKIDARERAMEMVIPVAVKLMEGGVTVDLVKLADEVKDYLIGDADLPETEPTAEDVATKAIERLLSAYGLNGGEDVKPRANAVSGFPIVGVVPQSEE